MVVALSRNFGHQTALGAALDYVSGDVAVLMDGDLQDPPEAIPILLDSYLQGYDVVYVRRVNRKESWWLRLCYYIFYRLLAALSVGMGIGLYVAGAPRLVTMAAFAPALMAGLTVALNQPRGRTTGR